MSSLLPASIAEYLFAPASSSSLSVHLATLAAENPTIAAASCATSIVLFIALRRCSIRRFSGAKLADDDAWRGALDSPLFESREFVRDMARLAEHIVMNDIPNHFWDFDGNDDAAAERLRLRLQSRERAPFFAPDKVGQVTEKPEEEKASCHVRWQRAKWCVAFKNQYSPSVADWIDTGIDTEKPAAVLLLTPKNGKTSEERRPLVCVTFRGSKTLQDYVRTDASPSFIPLPLGDTVELYGVAGSDPSEAGTGTGGADGDGQRSDEVDGQGLLQRQRSRSEADMAEARWMPFLAAANAPCVTLGAWKAYAGEEKADHDAPRGRVRRAVERLLKLHPKAKLVVTGHSLGGALATLCAFDLIAQSATVRAAQPMTLINFAAPRMFNQAFQDAMARLQDAGALHALRVVVGGDMIARIPPKQLGSVHGVLPRLLLDPGNAEKPLSFSSDDPDDEALWKITPGDSHICHALYLGGEKTPDDSSTIPKAAVWPLARSAPAGGTAP